MKRPSKFKSDLRLAFLIVITLAMGLYLVLTRPQ
jgi:hypothetical protein